MTEANRPDLFREVEVDGKGGRDAVFVEVVARVALHDEPGELLIERRVVVASPGEAFSEEVSSRRGLPGGVVFDTAT